MGLSKATAVYDAFWQFAAERQAIFFRRIFGAPDARTTDPVLLRYRFTNAYRASDRVSQYLIRHVIYHGAQDANEVAFRILLFKTFNKIETWEFLQAAVQEISISSFSVARYDKLLCRAQRDGLKIYSGAYILPSGKTSFGSSRKHENHLSLLERMIKDRIGDRIAGASSLKQVNQILLSYPTIGPFLAFQYTIDFNYSALINFSEMDHVVAGPGARSGIEKCFVPKVGASHEDMIRYVTDNQEREFERRGIDFMTLWGRRLQLIDVQNLFCEIDKYARARFPESRTAAGRHQLKRRYSPNSVKIEYWFPPKWGLNGRIRNRGEEALRVHGSEAIVE